MKTLILGFDSFDPTLFENMAGKNQLPNLEKFCQPGGYARLEVSSPPQTEVSWTSIATGLDPGGHGVFDFVHRDPDTYIPYVSILRTRKGALGEQFVPPYTTKTFFEEAAELGYPATALWWPAMFPARPVLPVNTLPGLGTPDIRGQLGVGTLLTTEDEALKKTSVVKLTRAGKDRLTGSLPGPQTQRRDGPRAIHLPLTLEVIDQTFARLTIDNQQCDLRLGEWSDIFELRFKAGMLFNNRMDVVQDWYRRLDRFVGDIGARVEQWSGKYRYLILSDHGFSEFRTKVHLNRWLFENGYLLLKNEGSNLSDVDWSKTKAYAVGLNSIYLNVAGREGQGIVAADAVESLLREIQTKLLDWRDADQSPIIQKIRLKHETYSGPYTRFGPDLVIGYAPGYRASAETGLGKVPTLLLEPNTDHWGADHCVDSEVVPGVIFANRDLRDFGTISFRDIPFLAIGKHLDPSNIRPPSQSAGQGQEEVEERLKGLGYL